MIIWIVLAVLSVILTITLIAFALPKVLLSEEILGANSGKFFSYDRGYKKVADGDVRHIVYAPAPKYRRAIDRYALSSDDKEITLIAHAKDGVKNLDYDVFLFDEQDKVFKVINVKETIKEADGTTKPLVLPEKTSYVNVRVNRADDEVFGNGYTKKIPAKNLFLFLLFDFLVLAMELVFLNVACAEIFGGLYTETFLLDSVGVKFVLITTGIAVALDLLISFIILKSYGKKGGNVNA